MLRNDELIGRYLGFKVLERIKERSGMANYRLLISMLDNTADDVELAEHSLNRMAERLEEMAKRLRGASGTHPRHLNPLGEMQSMGNEIDTTVAARQAAITGMKRLAKIICDGE